MVWGSLRLINRQDLYKIEHISFNLISTTKFNDSSILISIISWDYLATSQYQPKLSSITNVVPGGSANQIAV
jgi:hypothetical protein